MFNRIRYAAHVLSPHKPDLYNQPDIVFVEEENEPVSGISRVIAGLLSVFAVAIVFGAIVAPFIAKLPVVPAHDVTIATGVVAIFLSQLWHHLVRKMQEYLQKSLRLQENLAPHFGRRLTRAIHTLRG